MLLSPLASPSRFTPKSLGLPLPSRVSCQHIVEDEDVFSLSSDDDDGIDFDRVLDHEECASSKTSDDDLEPEPELERVLRDYVDSIATPAPALSVDEYVSPPGELVDAPPHKVEVEAEPPILPTSSPPPQPKSLISLTRPAPASPCTTEPQLNFVPETHTESFLDSYSNSEVREPADALALPVELIFTIVELAAGLHRRTVLSLCRVSSWVRVAVLPILYGTLVLQGRDRVVPFDAVNFNDQARDGGNGNGYCATGRRRRLENPLHYVRSLWIDLPPDRAPDSLDACPRLVQLALPLEAHATICNTQRWVAYDPRARGTKGRVPPHFGRVQSASLPEVGFRGVGAGMGVGVDAGTGESSYASSSLPTWRSIGQAQGAMPWSFTKATPMPMRTQSTSNALHIENVFDDGGLHHHSSSDDTSPSTNDNTTYFDSEDTTPCRSFTVLGQSHPHRWAPLTSSPNGRAFLRGVTHLRILNLCLSHYIPLEYTPNLTHLCIPFFDLRLSPSTLSSHSPTTLGTFLGDPSPLPSFSSLTGSAATSSFTGLDYILSSASLQMVVLTLNPRYWRFDELSLKGWALRAMARDKRLYVVAETRDDATRDWEVPRRDWEEEARTRTRAGAGSKGFKREGGAGREMSVWEKAVLVRRKFLTRLSRNWSESAASR